MGTPLASGERQAVSEVGLRLQRLRRKAGLSQAAVAERLNRDFNAHVNKGMISKYENGIHEPSAGTVFCLAKVLGVSTEYLMGKTDALQTFAAQQGADLPGRVIKVYSRYNSIVAANVSRTRWSWCRRDGWSEAGNISACVSGAARWRLAITTATS